MDDLLGKCIMLIFLNGIWWNELTVYRNVAGIFGCGDT